MTGIEAIAAERQRQIDVEGYTPEHDQEHHNVHQLEDAALAYIATARGGEPPAGLYWWPWDKAAFKPSTTERDLAKAGALIAAALDSLVAPAAVGGETP